MDKKSNNFKDITGQRFGKLVVMEYAGSNDKGKAMWKCKCDCGGECIAPGVKLRSGRKTSCGCKGGVFKDLTGKKFYHLEVLKYEGSSNGNGALWLCQCDCGNKCKVLAKKLLCGDTRSCGCRKERLIDLTGRRYGRLEVIKKYKSLNSSTRWLCKCDCGNYTVVHANSLKSGNTKSCGCIKIETQKMKATHGMTHTPLYGVWNSMKQRCNNPNSTSFKSYGARGISVCEEWENDFYNFYEWAISNGYAKGLSIDRIDVNGNYEPGNCRWADNITQANNKRNNVCYELNGETKTINQWCREYNISYSVVHQRIKKFGYTLKEALETPVKKYGGKK